jgi:hypothetical protein
MTAKFENMTWSFFAQFAKDITTLYPVNLAVIQQFFNNSQLRKVLADTSFNNSIDIKIPPFKIYEHKMANKKKYRMKAWAVDKFLANKITPPKTLTL